jgi:2-hydroxycyclohexanecarboxyl-CoA dehydrogenase
VIGWLAASGWVGLPETKIHNDFFPNWRITILMDLELRDRVAVVTGGASGIGAATVRRFQAEGSRVAIWDVAAAECYDPQRLSLRCDVTQPDSVQAALQRTIEAFGAIDCLVHTAAIGSGKFGFPYFNVPPEAWPRVLEVNIMGMVHVAHAVGEAMVRQGNGSMVFVSSVAGQMGSQTDPPYSASKAANINFSQCLAKDLASQGIRVNTVCPGMVRTPLNKGVWQAWHDSQPPEARRSYDDWADDKVRKVVPLGRWQEVEDVADMLVFLSSQRARQVTGQTINVDGGFVMHC